MQKESGEFPTFWSHAQDMSLVTYAESPFVTGMVVLALSKLRNEEARLIRSRSCQYLKAKRKSDGCFCFFDQGLDPDLDDTCLLNWALQCHEADASFSYRRLARRLALLPKQNELYLTWLRAGKADHNDIDPCVSANVIRFLARNAVPCAKTVGALRKVLQQDQCSDGTRYYESPFALAYLIVTLPSALRHEILGNSSRKNRLIERLACASAKQRGSVLDRALLLTVLSCCSTDGIMLSALAEALTSGRDTTGGWPNAPAFRAFNYWGSAALTTAVAIQALECYRLRIS